MKTHQCCTMKASHAALTADVNVCDSACDKVFQTCHVVSYTFSRCTVRNERQPPQVDSIGRQHR